VKTRLDYYDDGEEQAVMTIIGVAKKMADRPLTTQEIDSILQLVEPFMLREFPDWELHTWIGNILARREVDAEGR